MDQDLDKVTLESVKDIIEANSEALTALGCEVAALEEMVSTIDANNELLSELSYEIKQLKSVVYLLSDKKHLPEIIQKKNKKGDFARFIGLGLAIISTMILATPGIIESKRIGLKIENRGTDLVALVTALTSGWAIYVGRTKDQEEKAE